MSICREVAGFSFGHADVVRRAMAKKKADMLNAEREAFVNGAIERSIPEADAKALFEELTSFANYAFNKSHATAYAIISYQTAYLKAHYPAEYMSALLTSVQDNLTKLSEYISECSRLGIRVLPPDINASGVYFTPSQNDIVFGLLALKNVGKQFVENIIKERKTKKATIAASEILGGRRGPLSAESEMFIEDIRKNPGSLVTGHPDPAKRDTFKIWLLKEGNDLLRGTAAARPAWDVK